MTDQPLLSIDVVPVRFTEERGMQLGLGVRLFEPFRGELALPGVLLVGEERLAEAAYRALAAKVGLGLGEVRALVQVTARDNPERDPRGPTVSVSYLAVVAPDAVAPRAVWRDWVGGDPLPFDHDRIVAAAADRLRVSVWQATPEARLLTRALTGETFSTRRAARLTEAVTGVRPEPGNFNRMLRTAPDLARCAGVEAAGRGRPAALWAWGQRR
ncbi:NUDIX domain-containing protein [Klugiella xanthotipulae]|uniref:ADP-ribose pyrophosphatase YjhB (NUDIX family) n=1 Tax=Klugiella xanthotipulae TaxID=244735 RepID=A0A543I654_9MICO|nr:NUDIX hydrolase [Klugiella xanthotipulae]TQM66086.1 ADP-ribose pyrophosphatase YjhB (NUDIX family) [Klugiella xanthotipulae]